MALPLTRYGLPFNITRASHLELRVADLERSLRFYTEVIGLAVTLREDGVAWLRGMEESCHHSLVLRATTQAPACPYLGFRVFSRRGARASRRAPERGGTQPDMGRGPVPGPHAPGVRSGRGTARVLRADAGAAAAAHAV